MAKPQERRIGRSTVNAAYRIEHEVPPVADYIQIRLAAGLSRKSEEAAGIGLSNSLASVCVYCGEERVGIGRVVGDGGCFFEIVDIAVVPAHQKKGLGAMIMNALLEFLHSSAPDTAYVSLMADHGTPDFYTRFGFEPSVPPEKCGMSMRIDRSSSKDGRQVAETEPADVPKDR